MKTHLNSFNPFANASGISIEAMHLKPSQGFKILAIALGMTALMFSFAMPFAPQGLMAHSYLAVLTLFFIRGATNMVHTVRKQKNGMFMLESQKKTWNNMQLLGSSLSTPFLCVLYFKPQNKRWVQPVVIWADSVPDDVFRRLRGWLNWCAQIAE